MTNLQPYLDFAMETAYLAGKLTLSHFNTGVTADFKQDDSPVTIADKNAETLIRQRVEKKYPNHTIVGEEYGVKENEGATFRWYIDPIDGTKSFIRGVPLYAVLIGLEIEDQVDVGVVYFPALDEMISAATGLGCRWNGRLAQVSQETDLSRAFVAHIDTASFAKHGRQAEWERIQAATYYRAGWTDAYAYGLCATGRVELSLDPIMSVWDCGPYPPIFREAGGFFGDWQGKETIHAGESIATSQALLPQVLEILNDN